MPRVLLRPMTGGYYDGWVENAIAGYAQQIVDAGIIASAEALERGRKDFAELLPDGVATDGQHLFTVFDAETDASVGSCWLRIDDTTPAKAFIYSFDIDPDKQRRGYGRAMMAAIVDECRGRDVGAISLNVFASNPGAKALYEQAGFVVTSSAMKLTL